VGRADGGGHHSAGGGAAIPDLTDVFRAEYGRAVAVLTRVLGDLDLAEEAVQDAFTVASAKWPAEGVPPSPAGWIITTARNRAVDRLRRESVRAAKEAEAAMLVPTSPAEEETDQLRLIFTCTPSPPAPRSPATTCAPKPSGSPGYWPG
jgi:RNA polymerase sigma-70 factor (ECF subfamily)